MTFLELTKKLRFHCGVSGIGPSSVIDQTGDYERLVDWIRDAWTEIQNTPGYWRFMWKEDNFNTVAGTMDYDIFTNQNIKKLSKQKVYSHNVAAGRTSMRMLRYMEYAVWKERYFKEDQTKQDVPEYFTILPNTQMRIWPNPNDIYQIDIEGCTPPVILAANDDEPAMPEEYHMAIVFYAMMTYAGYEYAPELAQLGSQRWVKFYDEMKKNLLIKTKLAHKPLA